MIESSETLQLLTAKSKKHKVLTREGEKEMFEYFFKHHDPEICTHKLGINPPNMLCMEADLPRLKEIQDNVVFHNIRLVISIARKHQELGLPLEDLIHEGIGGLIHAFHRFEPARGNKLSTPATIWIRQYIGRALENKSRLVRLPNNKLQLISKLKRIVRSRLERGQEKPTAEQIVLAFSKLEKPIIISVEEVEELGRLQFGYVSLDQTGEGDEENLSMINYIPSDYRNQPEEVVEYMTNKSYLNELLSKLEPEERKYLTLKYGLLDYYKRTNKELISVFKKTTKELQLMELEIIAKLRQIGDPDKINF